MGSIRHPSNPGSGSTEDTDLIQCVDGWDPHIHKVWGLVLYGIIRKVHPTAQLEVTSGTVGEFVTNYLSKNGHIIQIIRQLYVNDSIQFLGVPDQGEVSGLSFIFNIQARAKAIGWVSGNYYNQEWGESTFDTNIIMNVAWGSSVAPRPTYLPRIPINPRAAKYHVCNNFLSCSRQESLWRQYNWLNPLVNLRVHRRYENRYGPVTQYSII